MKYIKSIFWKTYLAKAVSQDGKFYSYAFFRGFTWEVVEMANEWAEKKYIGDNKFSICELTRIY